MIDTTDLPSYIPGYDDYCERKEFEPEHEEDIYEDIVLEKEMEKMEREVINVNDTNMTLEDAYNLDDYVWEGDKLVPIEILECE